MTLRVLLVTDVYPPLIGGVERQMQLLGRRLHEQGHEVVVATAWQVGLPAYECEEGVEVHRIRGLAARVPWFSTNPQRRHHPPLPDPVTVWALRRLLDRFRPHVVHTYGWITYSCAVALVGRKIPLLLSVREYGYTCALRTMMRYGREPCTGPAPAKCMACAATYYGPAKGLAAVAGVSGGRWLLRHKVKAVHSVSAYVQRLTERDLFGDQARSSGKASRLHVVIPSFHVAPKTEPVDASAIATCVSQLPAKPYILFVGALRLVKGVQPLLEAYQRLKSPQQTISQWVQSNKSLLTNAASLVSTTVVTSALGFVYWWVAARYFPPAAVGLAAAAVSAMMLLSSVSSFGLGTLLVGELLRQPERRAALIFAALVVVSVAGVGLGALFAVLAPRLSAELQPLAASVFSVTVFAFGVAVNGTTIVLDQAVIGLFRGGLQLWRNSCFATIKLALLAAAGLWLVHRSGMTIYSTWVIGSASSLLLLVLVAARSGASWQAYRPQWGLLKQLRKSAFGHHALNLTLQGPSLALPVLTTALLSATSNAYFYAAWMMARFIFVGPVSLTVVLHAVGAAEPEVLARKARHSVIMSVGIGILANVVVLVGAERLLTVFGRDYADQAAWSLRLLALAVFPLTVRYHYIALARIQGWMAKAAVVMTFGAILELSMAAIGARMGGLTGLSLAWVSAICLQALFMARPVYRMVAPVTKQEWNQWEEKAMPF